MTNEKQQDKDLQMSKSEAADEKSRITLPKKFDIQFHGRSRGSAGAVDGRLQPAL